MISKALKFVVGLGLSGVCGALMAAIPAANLESLTRLESQKKWKELSENLGLLPEQDRSDVWEKMLESSVRGLLSLEAFDTMPPRESLQRAEDLLRKYPQVRKNIEIMDLRATLVMKVVSHCFESGVPAAKCTPMLRDYVALDPQNRNLNLEAGRMVSRRDPTISPLEFFDAAIRSKEDAALCRDQDLQKTVFHALGLPSAGRGKNESSISIAKRIASTVCWENYRADLIDHFEEERAHFRHNTCGFLKKNRGLTAQQIQRCDGSDRRAIR
ncbi:MAG: hypothetical protein K2X47_17540 [Bdellovibrionales bacterium]|nr:hypothetical protein [Bdellovibrionales bacterium]